MTQRQLLQSHHLHSVLIPLIIFRFEIFQLVVLKCNFENIALIEKR